MIPIEPEVMHDVREEPWCYTEQQREERLSYVCSVVDYLYDGAYNLCRFGGMVVYAALTFIGFVALGVALLIVVPAFVVLWRQS